MTVSPTAILRPKPAAINTALSPSDWRKVKVPRHGRRFCPCICCCVHRSHPVISLLEHLSK